MNKWPFELSNSFKVSSSQVVRSTSGSISGFERQRISDKRQIVAKSFFVINEFQKCIPVMSLVPLTVSGATGVRGSLSTKAFRRVILHSLAAYTTRRNISIGTGMTPKSKTSSVKCASPNELCVCVCVILSLSRSVSLYLFSVCLSSPPSTAFLFFLPSSTLSVCLSIKRLKRRNGSSWCGQRPQLISFLAINIFCLKEIYRSTIRCSNKCPQLFYYYQRTAFRAIGNFTFLLPFLNEVEENVRGK